MTAIVAATDLVREFVVHRARGRLRRERRVVRALDGVSFAVQHGETIGYIGANGAGKSTTIKLITGILQASAGTVRTFGVDPLRHRREVARRVGVVFGQRSQLWHDLPLIESFTILGAVHRLSSSRLVARRDELVTRLELGHVLSVPVRQLSLGERMRGEIAAALLHSPELLVLDEPTIGLDVLSKERLRLFLAEENRNHARTMLLTTHDMDDVERLCERLIVVDHGQLAYDGDAAGLAEKVGVRRVLVVDLAQPVADLRPGLAAAGLIALNKVEISAEADGLRHRLAFAPADTTAAALLTAVGTNAEVRDLSLVEPDIEDVVRRLYLSTGRDLRPPPSRRGEGQTRS